MFWSGFWFAQNWSREREKTREREKDRFYGYKTMYTVWLEWGKIDTKSKSKSFFLAFFSFALALSLFVSWAVVAVHIIRLANAWTGFGDASKMRFMSSLLATPIPTIPLHKINWHPETVFSHTITVSTLSLARSGFFALSCSFLCFLFYHLLTHTKQFTKKRKDLLILVLKTNLGGSWNWSPIFCSIRKHISILSKR